ASKLARDSAEDLAQEVLLVLHEKYPTLERVEDLVPLSLEIARFKIMGARRKIVRRGEHTQVSVDDLPIAGTGADPFEQAAEREALFEAALDDQEIFDELSREQALKELLAEPGAKQWLIAALQPAAKRPTRQAAWWVRPWPWATAAAAVAIGIVVWIAAPKPPPKREIAEVRTEVAPPQVAEPAQPPAVLHDSQKQTPRARPMATNPEKDTKKEEKLASVDARETVDAMAQVAAPQ